MHSRRKIYLNIDREQLKISIEATVHSFTLGII